jgi:hypothetical protein
MKCLLYLIAAIGITSLARDDRHRSSLDPPSFLTSLAVGCPIATLQRAHSDCSEAAGRE